MLAGRYTAPHGTGVQEGRQCMQTCHKHTFSQCQYSGTSMEKIPPSQSSKRGKSTTEQRTAALAKKQLPPPPQLPTLFFWGGGRRGGL